MSSNSPTAVGGHGYLTVWGNKPLSPISTSPRDRTSITSRNGILHHLRSTLSLVLLSLLVATTSMSLYLQFQLLNGCGPNYIVEGDEMNQPIESRQVTHLNDTNSLTLRRELSNHSQTIQTITFDHFSEKTLKNQSDSTEQKSLLIYTTMNINRKEPCDIPCEYTSDSNLRLNADASVYERRGYGPPGEGDKFSIYLQMEGEHYYAINLDRYHLENSYRWSSPLLKPYFEWIHYLGSRNISNPPVPFESTIDGASFIARNCNSRNQREDFVQGLRNAGIRVDGLSSCLQTSSPPQRDDKLAIMQPYKFTLAFENGNVVDYVTEKVYEALAAGVVPVYMGAPNIRDYVPDNSIIDVADFGFDTASVARHLKDCMNNQSLYESYHAWRFRALPEWFQQKFNFTWDTTECRTCRYVHAMQNGWKWDKELQRGIPPMD